MLRIIICKSSRDLLKLRHKAKIRQELKMIARNSHNYIVAKSAQCTLTKIDPFLFIDY